jgi:isopentenyl diphosphate isomerase/L-lactate dehydrogenase-like FMN-dependent dehydrogenase
MLTVDSATLGNREENDRLNGLKGDVRSMAITAEVVLTAVKAEPGVHMEPADGGDFFHDASISWDDLAWVKSLTKDTPLYLKGVASVEVSCPLIFV